jgi:hypothetical protein
VQTQPSAAPPQQPARQPEPTAKPAAPQSAAPQNIAPVEESPADRSRFAAEIDLDGIRRIWSRVLRRMTQMYPAAKAIFSDDVIVTGFEGRHVSVGFPREFERSRADGVKRREALEQALAQELGVQGLKIRCVLIDSPEAAPAAEPDHPLMDLLQGVASTTEAPSSNVVAPDIEIEEEPIHSGSNGNGAAPPVETPFKPRSGPDEHAAFVDVVKRELDCLPLED